MGTTILKCYSPLWTPQYIDTDLWLDASDSSTITLVSGAVSEWRDKSGNNRHLNQPTSNSRPLFNSSGLNSSPTIVFDGNNDFLRRTTQTLSSTPSVFLTITYDNTTKNRQNILCTDLDNTVPYLYLQADAGTLKGYNGSYYSAGFYTQNTPEITNINRVNVSGLSQIFRNGILTGNISEGGSSRNNALYLGFVAISFGAYPNMKISEVLSLANIPNIELRQTIEGYLAHKWGLTANLPINHPYKNIPPYV